LLRDQSIAVPGRLNYAIKKRRDRLRRSFRRGAMLRRYAPELFDMNEGQDKDWNVKPGSQVSMRDAMNGPFAPTSDLAASGVTPPGKAAAGAGTTTPPATLPPTSHSASNTERNWKKLPEDIRAMRRGYANTLGGTKPTFSPRIRALRELMDAGPFDKRRYANTFANPLKVFEDAGNSGVRGRGGMPLPFYPRLPFASADAMRAGMAPGASPRHKLPNGADLAAIRPNPWRYQWGPPPPPPFFASAPSPATSAPGGAPSTATPAPDASGTPSTATPASDASGTPSTATPASDAGGTPAATTPTY